MQMDVPDSHLSGELKEKLVSSMVKSIEKGENPQFFIAAMRRELQDVQQNHRLASRLKKKN